MMARRRRVLVEVIDERSMLTCQVAGAAERNSACTAHGGSHDDEDWGGIPVVIWVGDDYQLPPPTNKEKGAFDLMDSKTSFSQQKLSSAAFGAQVMWDMSARCVELRTTKRQNQDQQRFKDTLERLRIGEPTNSDASDLMDLHLTNMTAKNASGILQNDSLMHLFATKQARDEFNMSTLAKRATETNPAALIKSHWKTGKRIGMRTVTKHFDNPPPSAVLFNRGSKVRLVGKNIAPDLGLCNNAIGTVIETVFKPGKDPNNGDQPAYVAVRFPAYSGPRWCSSDPGVVPVPMLQRRCKQGCCTVTFCPLELSFGMTAHTFQGQSAGKVDKGQPKNAVDCIVFDPGTRRFEGSNPGLLYMGVSRATTTGTGANDSAIYFTGTNMNHHRVMNLTTMRDGLTPYKKIILRNKWVERLKKNTHQPKWTAQEKKELLDWAKNFKMTAEELEVALSRKNWRKNLAKTKDNQERQMDTTPFSLN